MGISAREQRKGDLAECIGRAERGIRIRQDLLMDGESSQDLSKAMLNAAELFESLGIGYALIGGLASMYYGRARFTEDVDFIAASGHEAKFAADPAAMSRHGFDPAVTWKLYHRSGVQIDIWKDQHADEMIGRAIQASLAGRKVKVVEVHDLIAMKLRADRPQDDYDISEVVKRGGIDDQTVRRLVTAVQYDHYLSIKQRVK